MESRIKRAAIALGLVDEAPDVAVRRDELPISGSPFANINPVNLTNPSVSVSPERAVGLTGVFRCVQVLATSISQLELEVWRGDELIPQPSTSVVVQPDSNDTLTSFLEETVTSLALTGNAYWLLGKDTPDTTLKTSPVKWINVLNPNTVRIEVDSDGKNWFVDGQHRYPSWRIKHLKHTRLPGYALGVGPIQVCQNELRGAIELRNYADNWFSDAKAPNYYLKTDQNASPEVLGQMGDAWQAALGKNQVPVIGAGLDIVSFALNPSDAQFLENQRFSLAQQARMFGVPGIILDLPSGDSMTYSNREDVINDFYRFTLKRYMTEIEGAFSALLVRGQSVKFDVNPLLGLSNDTTTVPDAPVDSNANTDTSGDSTNGN
jgi:HK97 family phage portal protein